MKNENEVPELKLYKLNPMRFRKSIDDYDPFEKNYAQLFIEYKEYCRKNKIPFIL